MKSPLLGLALTLLGLPALAQVPARRMPDFRNQVWNLAWVEPGALLRSGAVVVGGQHLSSDDPADREAVEAAIARMRRELGLGALINLRAESCEDQAAARQYQMPFLHLPLVDGHSPDALQVSRFFDFLHRARAARQVVLWHCAGGIGRTGVLCGMVRLRQGWTSAQAAREMFAMGLNYSQAVEHLPALNAFAALVGKAPFYPSDWSGPRTSPQNYQSLQLPPWP